MADLIKKFVPNTQMWDMDVTASKRQGSEPSEQGNTQELFTAVFNSIFSWARPEPGDPVQGRGYGWFWDTFSTIPYGSRLYQFTRRELTNSTLREIEQVVDQGLIWLVRQNVCQGYSIRAIRPNDNPNLVVVDVQITRYITLDLGLRFEVLWRAGTPGDTGLPRVEILGRRT